MSPSIYIIAGPNGVGKTTFAREFLPNYANCRNFINADLIAQGMAPFSPETAAFRAGKLMLTEIDLLAQRRLTSAVGLIAQSRIFWSCIVLWQIHGFSLTTL